MKYSLFNLQANDLSDAPKQRFLKIVLIKYPVVSGDVTR